jgi:hypothetical protein
MGRYFWHCPTCNGNFDPDEKCDCDNQSCFNSPRKIEKFTPGDEIELITHRKAGKESETLIIGFDYGNGEDVSCLTVGKKMGDILTTVNVIYGKEAEQTYEFLLTRGGTVKI